MHWKKDNAIANKQIPRTKVQFLKCAKRAEPPSMDRCLPPRLAGSGSVPVVFEKSCDGDLHVGACLPALLGRGFYVSGRIAEGASTVGGGGKGGGGGQDLNEGSASLRRPQHDMSGMHHSLFLLTRCA